MKKVLLTVVIVLVLLAGLALALMYTGAYDVSAMKQESSLTQWATSTMMDHSVRRQAAGIEAPGLDDSAMIAIGFDHYSEMCVTCHGSPADGRSEAGQGLNPPAPDLSEAAADWTPAELYWIIKNGITMTGMPAFGPTHDERELWSMVAFVRRLPGMSAEQYKSFSPEATAHEGAEPETSEKHSHRHAN